MQNSTSELLYVAYKNILLKNIESGFFRQHSSDADYYVLDKMPELLFEVLDTFWKRYSTSEFLEKFFELNPHRFNDTDFCKKVFLNIRNSRDFEVLLSGMNQEELMNDIPLLVKAFEKMESDGFENMSRFTKVKYNQKFMEAIYDSDKFSLTYFKLPAPTDDSLVKKILNKDPKSFMRLNLDQQANKEYVIIALEKGLEKTPGILKDIYKFIPKELQEQQDIALLSSKFGCIDQPVKAYNYENVLLNVLKATFKPNERLKIEDIPTEVFKRPQNILDLFEWMESEKEKINTSYENYASVYKTIKAIAKIDPYVKEQFGKQDSEWNKGSLGDAKAQNSVHFSRYFKLTIPKLVMDLKYYVMSDELSKSPNSNEEKEKKFKL